MFAARPPRDLPSRHDLHLIRATRATFTGSADFLSDPPARARIAEYLADMAGTLDGDLVGQSYGEMGRALIDSAVRAGEPVDLLVLAFSIHDLRPGRQTAAYLSHVTPGAPMAFSVCDQGSAAAFTGLRLVREYAASAGVRRALVVVVEQAALPYDCPVPLPSQHQGVAMLLGDSPAPRARIVGIRQHPGVAPAEVAAIAEAEISALAHHETRVVLSETLAVQWRPAAVKQVSVMPAGQPSTGVWWGLVDELASSSVGEGLLVVADYDPALRYLCLTAFETLV